MKKLIIAGAFVIGGFVAAQAQTATTGQEAPSKNGRTASEAPRVGKDDAAGNVVAPTGTTTGTRPATTTQTTELQPASTPHTVINPSNRVQINGSTPTPVQSRPVKKDDTTPAPKN